MKKSKILNDKEFVLKHTTLPIYLMIDHKWSFIIWEYLKLNKELDNACLVHVDTHLDDVPELVTEEYIMSASTVEELKSIIYFKNDENSSRYELRCDNFLIPSFLRDTIQDIIYVSNPENESECARQEISIEDIYNYQYSNQSYIHHSGNVSEYTLSKCHEYIQGKNKSIKRYLGTQEFLNSKENHFRKNQQKILDLDLDFFNNSNTYFEAELQNEEQIQSQLLLLKKMTEWDLITVAVSPGYSGEEVHWRYLVAQFLNVFEINEDDFEIWKL